MTKNLWCWLCLIFISWGLASCSDAIESVQAFNTDSSSRIPKAEKIAEVAPPKLIQELGKTFDQYQPQVKIITPTNNQILQDTTVKVGLEIKDLPIFKDEKLAMGPHLHLFIDNQPYKAVYSTDKPVVLENLAPGTHTIRVFASRPWHESFKNEGAYAQTTFHIFTSSDDNNPDLKQPLLTYSRPEGTYGAEPIMLDYYLTNAPLHIVAQENSDDNISDWRIRVTINGEDFLVDTWQPIYLQGFNQGQNWLKLEFIDENGEIVKNVFNSSTRIINYEPKQQDTLTKLVKGKISLEQARAIVEPNYQPQIIPEDESNLTSETEVLPTEETITTPENESSSQSSEIPSELKAIDSEINTQTETVTELEINSNPEIVSEEKVVETETPTIKDVQENNNK